MLLVHQVNPLDQYNFEGSMKTQLIIVSLSALFLQACSFTNRPFEKLGDNTDFIRTATDLKIGEERTIPAGSKAYESTLFVQRTNTVQCNRDISYKDGLAEFRIPKGTYKAIGLIEVEPNKKLPFFKGSYQSSAVGGAGGMSLYFPINPDGSLYKSYYTDPYGNLHLAKGELKEWAGNGVASGTCIPPAGLESPRFSVCSVYYNGPTRQNGLLAPTITIDNGVEKRNLAVRANTTLGFCGVGIDIHETTNILNFTVRSIVNN